MRRCSMRTDFMVLILGFTCLMTACQNASKTDSRVAALPYYNEASFTPRWLSANDPVLDTFHQISDFELTDQDGKRINLKTFEDKIYVTDFFFTTCPGICPKMTKNMSVIQQAFLEDDEVLLLSHSVTPSIDSVEVLKNYAEAMEVVSGKWHLVTGNRKDIYDLGRRSYFIEEDLGLEKTDDEFLHTENFVLIDKNRHIRGIYNGLNKTSINQLITDIKTLKKES